MTGTHITVRAQDDWLCICGNEVHTGGFYPYSDGREVEPVDGVWDGHLFFCADCGRVIDQDTGEVVAHASEITMLEGNKVVYPPIGD